MKDSVLKVLRLIALSILFKLLLSGCSGYNIPENYKEFDNTRSKIKMVLLSCYIEGEDRQSPKLQKACNDFIPKFGDYIKDSGYFAVVDPSYKRIETNEYSEFLKEKDEIYNQIKNNTNVDFSVYGITEVGNVGINDKFCLVFVDMNNYEEYKMCDKSSYLISGGSGNYHLDVRNWNLVSSFVQSKSMMEMEKLFKSRLK